MNSINFSGQPDYPLACQDMDMLQEMITLSAALSYLGGDKYILKGCADNDGIVDDGIVVINGTPYRFVGGQKREKVTVVETKIDRMEFGKTYPEARTVRIATFSDAGAHNWSDFERATTNRELRDKFASIRGDTPGTVKMWAGQVSKIPAGYRLCNGDEMLINDYPELFDVLGVAFGGDGLNSFRLPDLRGRFVVGYDNSDNDCNIIGQKGGMRSVALTEDEIPEHDHTKGVYFNKLSARASDIDATNTPGAIDNNAPDAEYRIGGMTNLQWQESTIAKVGKGEAHENRPPFFVLAYIIKVTV
jgi:microcystin-dependent protein